MLRSQSNPQRFVRRIVSSTLACPSTDDLLEHAEKVKGLISEDGGVQVSIALSASGYDYVTTVTGFDEASVNFAVDFVHSSLTASSAAEPPTDYVSAPTSRSSSLEVGPGAEQGADYLRALLRAFPGQRVHRDFLQQLFTRGCGPALEASSHSLYASALELLLEQDGSVVMDGAERYYMLQPIGTSPVLPSSTFENFVLRLLAAQVPTFGWHQARENEVELAFAQRFARTGGQFSLALPDNEVPNGFLPATAVTEEAGRFTRKVFFGCLAALEASDAVSRHEHIDGSSMIALAEPATRETQSAALSRTNSDPVGFTCPPDQPLDDAVEGLTVYRLTNALKFARLQHQVDSCALTETVWDELGLQLELVDGHQPGRYASLLPFDGLILLSGPAEQRRGAREYFRVLLRRLARIGEGVFGSAGLAARQAADDWEDVADDETSCSDDAQSGSDLYSTTTTYLASMRLLPRGGSMDFDLDLDYEEEKEAIDRVVDIIRDVPGVEGYNLPVIYATRFPGARLAAPPQFKGIRSWLAFAAADRILIIPRSDGQPTYHPRDGDRESPERDVAASPAAAAALAPAPFDTRQIERDFIALLKDEQHGIPGTGVKHAYASRFQRELVLPPGRGLKAFFQRLIDVTGKFCIGYDEHRLPIFGLRGVYDPDSLVRPLPPIFHTPPPHAPAPTQAPAPAPVPVPALALAPMQRPGSAVGAVAVTMAVWELLSERGEPVNAASVPVLFLSRYHRKLQPLLGGEKLKAWLERYPELFDLQLDPSKEDNLTLLVAAHPQTPRSSSPRQPPRPAPRPLPPFRQDQDPALPPHQRPPPRPLHQDFDRVYVPMALPPCEPVGGRDRQVFIYVDYSNVQVRLSKAVQVMQRACAGRTMARGIVAGSLPASNDDPRAVLAQFDAVWREQAGFETHMRVVPPGVKETWMDDLIQAFITQDVAKREMDKDNREIMGLEPLSPSPVLVLFSNDSNDNLGGVGSTFPRVIALALRSGWHVEVWAVCWQGINAMSAFHLRQRREHPLHYRLFTLDMEGFQ